LRYVSGQTDKQTKTHTDTLFTILTASPGIAETSIDRAKTTHKR